MQKTTITLRSLLIGVLSVGPHCSYGMLRLQHNVDCELPSQQRYPRNNIQFCSTTLTTKLVQQLSSVTGLVQQLPPELNYHLLEFMAHDLRAALKLDVTPPEVVSSAPVIMRAISRLIDIFPHADAVPKQLDVSCAKQVACYLYKTRNEEFKSYLYKKFSARFLCLVAHFMHHYVYGPDRLVHDASGVQRTYCVYWACASEDPKDRRLKIAFGGLDGRLALFDVSGELIVSWQGHNAAILVLCLVVDSNDYGNPLKIISGSRDGSVKIWNTQGKLLATCKRPGELTQAHEEPVYALSMVNDPFDGRLKIISGSYDKTIRVWDVNGTCLATCHGHESMVCIVTCIIDPQDEYPFKIASGSWDGTITLWAPTGEIIASRNANVSRANFRESHTKSMFTVFDPADKTWKILAGFSDGTIKIWDTRSRVLVGWKGHEASVNVVRAAVDPEDGTLKIFSGSADKTVKIWKTDGTCLTVCAEHAYEVKFLCVAVDPVDNVLKVFVRALDPSTLPGSTTPTMLGTLTVWDVAGKKLATGDDRSKITSLWVVQDRLEKKLKVVTGSGDCNTDLWSLKAHHGASLKDMLAEVETRRSKSITFLF